MKLQYTNRRRRSRVELRRDERCPLGIGVTENQRETGRPIIKNLKHGSIAHKSHSLAEGDVILSINGKDPQSMRKKEVKRLLKENELLDIEVEYLSREASSSKIQCSQRMFLTLKKESGSFGFVVRRDVTEYPLISNIKHDGPADKDGSMMAGDRLLEVDSQSLSWVSLTDVATLLQEKDDAVFLIEYNVGIISLPHKEVEMEIDCPDTNLGMTVNTFADDSSRMYIASIQQGGLAQRCGAFHVGDEIVSIDDTEVKDLTIVRVNDLLRRFRKKPGKLKFVHNKEKSAFASQDSLSRNNSKTESTADLAVEQGSYDESSPENNTYQTISTSSHLPSNCSISSNINSLTEDNFSHKVGYGTVFDNNQLKTLSILRYINLNVTNLQYSLAQAERKAAQLGLDIRQAADLNRHQGENVHTNMTENKFSKLNADCLTIRNLTRELSFHFIKNTAQLALRQNEKCTYSVESQKSSSTAGSLVAELVCNLNEITAYKFVPKTTVKKFIEAINIVDISCCKCRERCYSASFAVRKVLLLLSLNDQTSQAATLIRKVLNNVTEMRIPCEKCKIPRSTIAGASASIGQFCFPRLFETSNSSSSSSVVSAKQQGLSSRTQCSESIHEPHVGLDVAHQKAIYRLTDIQSSEKSFSATAVDKFAHIQQHSYPEISNRTAFHSTGSDTQNGSKVNAANSTKPFPNNQQEKEQSTQTMNSSWKSTEIIANRREELEQKFPSVILRSTTPKFPVPTPACSNQRSNVNNRCSFGFELTKEQPRNAETNANRMFTAVEIEEENSQQKHTATHNVKIKSEENNGFGLKIGYDSISREGAGRFPIIIAIRPKSPAARIGLLKTGDRILAINGRSTAYSSVNDLETLKRGIVSLDEIALKVEFDISEPIIKGGTFEINLEEHLKPGLVMDEPACPCKVKGLVKGGAAHRSGQVFPGDIILSFGSVKQENLDLQTWTTTKSKTFYLVVQRELGER